MISEQMGRVVDQRIRLLQGRPEYGCRLQCSGEQVL
jgi:hypothetical protein